jgi:putative inorganic carbon (HCO3(-)) transporter
MTSNTLGGVTPLKYRLSWTFAWRSLGIAVAVSFALGVGIAVLGSRLGPLTMLAVPGALAILAAAIDGPRTALALFVLSLPLGLLELPWGLKAAQVVAVMTVVLVVGNRMSAGLAPLAWAPSAGWALVFVCLALLATPGAVDVGVAVKQDISVVVGFLLALTVSGTLRKPADLRWLMGLLVVVGAGMCLYSLKDASQLHQSDFGAAVVANRAVGVFRQPNELGTFSVVVLMLSIGLCAGARRWAAQLLFATCSAAALAGLVLSLSRGAWLGAAGAVVLFIVLVPPSKPLVARVGIAALLITAAVVASGPQLGLFDLLAARAASISDATSNPYDDRPLIYREALRQIESRPYLGRGPGNFLAGSEEPDSAAIGVEPLHAHNVLLTVAAEVGIPAALALLGLSVTLGWRLLSRCRSVARGDPQQPLIAGLISALLAVVLQGTVDFTARNATVFMFLWLTLGLAWAAAFTAASPLQSSGHESINRAEESYT